MGNRKVIMEIIMMKKKGQSQKHKINSPDNVDGTIPLPNVRGAGIIEVITVEVAGINIKIVGGMGVKIPNNCNIIKTNVMKDCLMHLVLIHPNIRKGMHSIVSYNNPRRKRNKNNRRLLKRLHVKPKGIEFVKKGKKPS